MDYSPRCAHAVTAAPTHNTRISSYSSATLHLPICEVGCDITDSREGHSGHTRHTCRPFDLTQVASCNSAKQMCNARCMHIACRWSRHHLITSHRISPSSVLPCIHRWHSPQCVRLDAISISWIHEKGIHNPVGPSVGQLNRYNLYHAQNKEKPKRIQSIK